MSEQQSDPGLRSAQTPASERGAHVDAAQSKGRGGDTSYLAHTIEEIPAADGAELLTNLNPHEAANVAEYLDPETAGHVLSRMDPHDAAAGIEDMQPPEAAMGLGKMDPDDAVDVLAHINESRREQLLGEMDAPEAADVRNLRKYPPDSAGGIMTTDVTALPQDLTAQQAIDELRRLNETLEQMFYVY